MRSELTWLRSELAGSLLRDIGVNPTGEETKEQLWNILRPGWRTRLDLIDLSLNH
jgi:hypothetical protein